MSDRSAGSGHTKYFDCHATIGPNTFGLGEPAIDLASLLGEMDYAGIESALVAHYVAREFSPRKGNMRLLDEVANSGVSERIFPCAVFSPFEEGYSEDPEFKVKELREAGFLAVRTYPGEYNFIFDPRIMSAHLRALSGAKLPLFIERSQIEWRGLCDLAEAFPDLKIALIGEMYRTGRIVVPLLRTYKNVYFEVCGFETHRGIEELVGAVGARQLLFGSRIPEFSIGPARMMIDFAVIADEERSEIAGGNLANMLGIDPW